MYFLDIVIEMATKEFLACPFHWFYVDLITATVPLLSSPTAPSPFQFNLLFGWSIYNYRNVFSSAVTFVGFLMGISHHKEVKTPSCFPYRTLFGLLYRVGQK